MPDNEKWETDYTTDGFDPPEPEDDEEFCPTCCAGTESSQHLTSPCGDGSSRYDFDAFMRVYLRDDE